jgi:hypothetical protein
MGLTMGLAESEILHAIRLAQPGHVTLWRNQVGVAEYPGGARVPYGLCRGASDLIGIRSLVITPDLVGTTVGQFAAVEVKSRTGRLSREQALFLNLVRSKGGLAFHARSVEEALEHL